MNEKKIVKKRALRRHHASRLKKKAKQVFKLWDFGKGMSKGKLEEAVGRFHNNLAKCSCSMCGNPRKYGEKTLQERRVDVAALDEWGENTKASNDMFGGYYVDDFPREGWCALCERYVIGQCPSCGYTIED